MGEKSPPKVKKIKIGLFLPTKEKKLKENKN